MFQSNVLPPIFLVQENSIIKHFFGETIKNFWRYLNGFGGGGIKVGETNDPSKIVGDVGTMVELG